MRRTQVTRCSPLASRQPTTRLSVAVTSQNEAAVRFALQPLMIPSAITFLVTSARSTVT